MENMLSYCGMGYNAYDATLIGWEAKLNTHTPSGLTLGATNLEYCSANAIIAHNNLSNNGSWTFNGDANTCNVARSVNTDNNPFETSFQSDESTINHYVTKEKLSINNLDNGEIIVRQQGSFNSSTFKIEVLSNTGQLVYKSDYESFDSVIDLPLTTNGIYIVKVTHGEIVETNKITIP
jgi:hypothetical protein